MASTFSREVGYVLTAVALTPMNRIKPLNRNE